MIEIIFFVIIVISAILMKAIQSKYVIMAVALVNTLLGYLYQNNWLLGFSFGLVVGWWVKDVIPYNREV